MQPGNSVSGASCTRNWVFRYAFVMGDKFSKHKLTAIFYADVAGYSSLIERDEIGMHSRVMDLLDQTSEQIKSNEGKVLRYAGDAILAESSSILKLAQTAVEIPQEIANQNANLEDSERVQIRIGLNIGEVLEDRGEIYGDGVNLAARLEAAAEPGGICISAVVQEQLAGRLNTLRVILSSIWEFFLLESLAFILRCMTIRYQ